MMKKLIALLSILVPASALEAVAILRGVSTAFLDAYTKRDQAALDFLNTEALPDAAGSRPTLSRP